MTRISDLLAKGPTWSFEFFPPKTPEGMTSFDEAVSGLSALEPAFVSVTYGAGGSTRDEVDADAVLRKDDVLLWNAGSGRQCGVGAQHPPRSVHRHDIARAYTVVEEE